MTVNDSQRKCTVIVSPRATPGAAPAPALVEVPGAVGAEAVERRDELGRAWARALKSFSTFRRRPVYVVWRITNEIYRAATE
jgi:hypothetical protein